MASHHGLVAAGLLLLELCCRAAADSGLRQQPAAGERPHILMLLADDFGWANAGWHRGAAEDPDTRTPVMDALVTAGIELDRAYQYKFCSPSRCSLQSGRLPVHVNTVNNGITEYNPEDPVSGFQGIPRNMTGMAEHLKMAGYATHQVGKWDAGMATPDHTPHGRGYDSSLSYFAHMNDYWTMRSELGLVDLWQTDRPAFGLNGSAPPGSYHPEGTWVEERYEEFIFKERVKQIISDHDTATPLFLCYCFHTVHRPLEVPTKWFNKFSTFDDLHTLGVPHRHMYASMVNYMDDAIGEIVELLKRRSMWQKTLLVFQTDNGGPSFAPVQTANNFPLKGTKMSNWEGGIRGNAFVSGGFLESKAPERIGVKLEGYTHICDWYATFAALAGVDPTDHKATKAGLPPIDSLNLWPYLSGKEGASPRTEVFADPDTLIAGDWKIIGASARRCQDSSCDSGGPVREACWAGPRFPNSSSVPCARSEPCHEHGGCLYNIREDPGEYVDLAGRQPEKLQELQARLAQLRPTVFSPKRSGGGVQLPVKVAREVYGGYWGPFLGINTPGPAEVLL